MFSCLDTPKAYRKQENEEGFLFVSAVARRRTRKPKKWFLLFLHYATGIIKNEFK